MSDTLDVPALAAAETALAGRTVVVTGAGSAGRMAGVGAAIALRCAQAGAELVLVDHDAMRAQHTAAAIRDLRASADRVPDPHVLTADLTDTAAAGRIADTVLGLTGRIDVLVNSAGISPDESAGTPLDTWDRVFALNVRAAKQLLDAVLPAMRAQGGGAVVSVSSLAATRGGGGEAYSASKAALESLTRAVAHREGPRGIRVNAISPGHLHSPMGLVPANGLGGSTEADLVRARRAAASLLRTEGTVWHVADAALFLASDASRFITATTLEVDGGAGSAMPLALWQAIATAEAGDVG